jgi:hypothetical protein
VRAIARRFATIGRLDPNEPVQFSAGFKCHDILYAGSGYNVRHLTLGILPDLQQF